MESSLLGMIQSLKLEKKSHPNSLKQFKNHGVRLSFSQKNMFFQAGAWKVEEALIEHEQRYKENKDKIQRWQIALTEVANIKGWHLSNNLRLEQLHSKIDIGKDDVRIIGICGMGDIGKTTLASVVYTQMSPYFEAKSFLADVREVSEKHGFVSLQKQLLTQAFLEESFNLFNIHEGKAMISHRLSHKKVFVVVDDVDNIQHLKCLVGKHDWFGLGSRIIVTTRDEHLLQSYGVDDVYKPTTLDSKESLRLFNLKAFKSDTMPENDFIELSKCVVEYADGLPLALEVLGSFLCGRDVAQWRSAIQRLERDFNQEILDRLQISFDGLEETEKKIFLDIACFFNGEEKDFVIKVLDEELGRKIVRQKCVDEPGKRCRLWAEKDVYHVLTKNTATEAVEGVSIDSKAEQNKMFTLNDDAFFKMKKLNVHFE
ncbi:hypothetical protein DITRI_Ditri01bG0153000 [Diplodiscus trichospermus]